MFWRAFPGIFSQREEEPHRQDSLQCHKDADYPLSTSHHAGSQSPALSTWQMLKHDIASLKSPALTWARKTLFTFCFLSTLPKQQFYLEKAIFALLRRVINSTSFFIIKITWGAGEVTRQVKCLPYDEDLSSNPRTYIKVWLTLCICNPRTRIGRNKRISGLVR